MVNLRAFNIRENDLNKIIITEKLISVVTEMKSLKKKIKL